MLVGLPGSGKSTWARQQGVNAISSDMLRGWLADDETDQTIHREVFATLRYLLRRRLELRRPLTVVDATNLTPRERRPYIKLGQIYGCRVEAVFLDLPLDVCMRRNLMRDRVVPEEAFATLQRRLVPPSIREGFASVTVYRAIAAVPQPRTQQAEG